MMNNEFQRILKAKVHSLIETLLTFAWKDCGETRSTSVRASVVPAGIKL
jgi:hypothetical protein